MNVQAICTHATGLEWYFAKTVWFCRLDKCPIFEVWDWLHHPPIPLQNCKTCDKLLFPHHLSRFAGYFFFHNWHDQSFCRPWLKSRGVASNFLQTHWDQSTNQRAAILRRRTNQEPTFSLTPRRCNKANGDKQSLVLVPPGNCCNCEQCWSLPLSSSSPSSFSSTGWSPRILTGELKHWTRCRSQIRSIWFKFI